MEVVSMKISIGMMAKPSAWRPLFAARPFVNPQIARVFVQSTTPSVLSSRLGCFGCFSTVKRVAVVKSALSKKPESIWESCKYPRPQSVAWQKGLANTVQLIGTIGKPVETKYTQDGKPFAWANLAFKPSKSHETTWFKLNFFEELAKIAAEHVKANDRVYVSGSLDFEKADGENNNLSTVPQILVNALSFVEHDHPFPQSEDVNVNDSVETKEAEAKHSSSDKKTTMDAASTEKLWQAFFTKPDEWWDKRENKKNPKAPDFKHKNKDEALWIESFKTPSWVKSRLNTLKERKHEKTQENDAHSVVLKVQTVKKTIIDVTSTEKLWQEFFTKPDEWWDNRENKKNPKAPDFKHKNKDEVLWIDSFKTPSWVKSRLNTLEERKHEETQENDADGAVLKVQTDKKSTMDAASTEKLWQAFFVNPDEWWDNRENKKNAKAPDFKHKDTGEALWIEGFKNPSWVKSQLEKLEKRRKDSHQFTRSRESLSSFVDRDLMF